METRTANPPGGVPKVAVVTGAGSGIGREIARRLLAVGWHVALAGRHRDTLDETVRPTSNDDPWADSAHLVLPVDVTVPESVGQLFDAVLAQWGRVDLLVNNAGTPGPPGAVDEVSVEGWRSTVDTNLTGTFLCAHHAVRIMKSQTPRGGRIINNGSISAHVPRPKSAAYTATKHAITGLTKSIALDGRAHDIACGQIDIGNAGTDMTAGIQRGALQANGSLAAEATFDVAHVAEAVLFMASLPLDANVLSLTIAATKMPFVGRG